MKDGTGNEMIAIRHAYISTHMDARAHFQKFRWTRSFLSSVCRFLFTIGERDDDDKKRILDKSAGHTHTHTPDRENGVMWNGLLVCSHYTDIDSRPRPRVIDAALDKLSNANNQPLKLF